MPSRIHRVIQKLHARKLLLRGLMPQWLEKFIEALEWLTERERQAVLRYKFDQDRQLALGSQLLRRYYFAHYLGFDWSCLRFKAATAGKPFLDSPVISPVSFFTNIY